MKKVINSCHNILYHPWRLLNLITIQFMHAHTHQIKTMLSHKKVIIIPLIEGRRALTAIRSKYISMICINSILKVAL